MKKFKDWLPGTLVFISLLFYQLFFAFKFFPITEGWFSVYAWLIRSGDVPYRDFSLLMPPLYPLGIAFIQTVFGEGILVLRIIGVCVVSGIGVCLWFILSRVFNYWISALSAVVGCIYYQTGNAFIPYDFTQVLTLYLLLGSSFMLHSVMNLNTTDSIISKCSSSYFAGLFLGAAVLIKQSNAGFFTLAVSLGYAIILFRVLSFRCALNIFIPYVIGGFTILAIIFIWLGCSGAAHNFYYQVIFDALQSKGGGEKIITGWVDGFFGAPSYALRSIQITLSMFSILVWAGAPLMGYILLALKSNGFKDIKDPLVIYFKNAIGLSKLSFTPLFIGFITVGLIASWLNSPLQDPSSQNANEFTIALIFQFVKFALWSLVPGLIFLMLTEKLFLFKKNSSYLRRESWVSISNVVISLSGTIGIGALFVISYYKPQLIALGWRSSGSHFGSNLIVFSTNLYVIASIILLVVFFYKPTIKRATLWLIFLIGLGLVFGNGTSAGLSEISAFYGLSIYIAILLAVSAPLIVPGIVPLFISLQLTSFLVESKFSQPYAWWSVRSEDIRTVECANSDGLLSGVCINSKKYDDILRITKKITLASGEKDELYVFPHTPIFNLLSHQKPFNNLVVSWFDFTSQAKAHDIANALMEKPPKLILISRLPPEVFEAHERLFNQSKYSEQRTIVRSIDDLLLQGRIKLIDTVLIDGLSMQLYERLNANSNGPHTYNNEFNK